MMWSLLGASLIAVIVIALNGKREPRFQSPAFVFGGFSNETGWPDGVAWILGTSRIFRFLRAGANEDL